MTSLTPYLIAGFALIQLLAFIFLYLRDIESQSLAAKDRLNADRVSRSIAERNVIDYIKKLENELPPRW